MDHNKSIEKDEGMDTERKSKDSKKSVGGSDDPNRRSSAGSKVSVSVLNKPAAEADQAPTSSESSLMPERKSNVSRNSKPADLNLSASKNIVDPPEQLGAGENATKGKSQIQITRASISRKLMALMEEDSTEFSDFDIKELLPSSTLFPDNSFSKLKKFFEKTLAELDTGSKAGIHLEDIKEEFHHLWNGLQKRQKNLNSLRNSDVELTAEVTETMARTKYLILLSQEDKTLCLRLANRLENAWNLLDVSEEEARRNAARIEELKMDIMILNRNIQIAVETVRLDELIEIQAVRRKLQEDRDGLSRELSRMKAKVSMDLERKLRLEEKNQEFVETIQYCKEEASVQMDAYESELERKQNLHKRVEAVSEKIAKLLSELDAIERYSFDAKGRLQYLSTAVRNAKVINAAAKKQTDETYANLDKFRKQFDEQVATLDKLAEGTFHKMYDMKEVENEIDKLNAEKATAYRHLTLHNKRHDMLLEQSNAMDQAKLKLKNKVIQLEKEVHAAQALADKNRKRIHEMDQQRSAMSQNLMRASLIASKSENQLKDHEIVENTMERELGNYNREIHSQAEMMDHIEKDRDHYSHEAYKLAREYASRVEEVKKMDTVLYEFRRKIATFEHLAKGKRLEFEQSFLEKRFLEKLRRDSSAGLISAQRELRHQSFELNTAVFCNFGAMSNFKKQKALRELLFQEKDFFLREANRVKKMAVDMEREVGALEQETSTLGSACATGDNELAKQRYYARRAFARMENYNRRLQNRSHELEKVWEQWRSLHSLVRMGAYHHRNLLAEIRATRQDIMKLRLLQNKFKTRVNNGMRLVQEINVLQACIARETCMIHALEDELRRPVNIHRWRALEIIDPEGYAVIKKTNHVNKRLVQQNQLIRNKSLKLEEQQNTYVDLRGIILKLPMLETPELKEHYELLLHNRRERLHKLKVDLYSIGNQRKFYLKEVARLNRRMNKLKYVYFGKMERSNYSLWVRKIQEEFPIEKIDLQNLDVAGIRETFKSHQLQQEAFETCLARMKDRIQKRREDPDYSSEPEAAPEENFEEVEEQSEPDPGSSTDEDNKPLTDSSLEDLSPVRETFTSQPVQTVAQKYFPGIKTQTLADSEKEARWKAIIARVGRG